MKLLMLTGVVVNGATAVFNAFSLSMEVIVLNEQRVGIGIILGTSPRTP